MLLTYSMMDMGYDEVCVYAEVTGQTDDMAGSFIDVVVRFDVSILLLPFFADC